MACRAREPAGTIAVVDRAISAPFALVVMLTCCDGAATGLCGGDGRVVEVGADRYCVYAVPPGTDRADAVRCPRDAPERIELPDGIACAPSARSAADLPDEVCAVAGSGCGPAFAGPPLTWSRLEVRPPVPEPRYAAPAAYDAARDRVVLHGGSTGPGENPTALGQTWTITIEGNVASWQLVETATEPPMRSLPSHVHDEETGRLIVPRLARLLQGILDRLE